MRRTALILLLSTAAAAVLLALLAGGIGDGDGDEAVGLEQAAPAVPPVPAPAVPAAADGAAPEPVRRALPAAEPVAAPPAAGPQLPTGRLVVTVLDRATGAPVAGLPLVLYPEQVDGRSPPEFLRWMESQGWGEIAGLDEEGEIAFQLGTGLHSTDEDGDSEFPVPAGYAFSIFTNHERDDTGLAWENVGALAPGELRRVELRVPVGADLAFHGVALSGADGSPLGGAEIWLGTVGHHPDHALMLQPGSNAPPQPGSWRRFEADAAGRFVLRARSWKDPLLVLRAPGHAATLAFPEAGHEEPARAAELAVRAAAALHGRVTGPAGVPPGYLIVTCRAQDLRSFGRGSPGMEPGWWSEWNAEAAYRVEALPAGVPLRATLTLEDGRQVQVPGEIVLAPGEDRRRDFSLGGLTELRGRAVDEEGAPVADLEVVARQDERHAELPPGTLVLLGRQRGAAAGRARTGADGRFRFPELAPGRWLVGAEMLYPPERNEVSPAGLIVEIPPGAAVHEVELRLRRKLHIRGRVLDPAGAPLQATVLGWAADGRGSMQASTGADGRFALGPLLPGSYRLRASTGSELLRFAVARAAAGAADVLLQAVHAARVTGRVLDPDGRPVHRAEVRVTLRGSDSLRAQWTDPDGRFELDGLEDGVLDLWFSTPAGGAALRAGLAVEAGMELELPDVVLQPAARVEFAWAGAAGFATCVLRQGAAATRFFVGGKKPVTHSLPPGVWELEVVPDGAAPLPLRSLTVQPGEERRLELSEAD